MRLKLICSFINALYHEFLIEEKGAAQEKFITIPNIATFLGIAATGFYVFQFSAQTLVKFIPITVFLVALSDLCDGFLARRLNQHSWIGKLIDSIRDKFLRIAVFLNLGAEGILAFHLLLAFAIVAFCEIVMLFCDCQNFLQKKEILGHPLSRFMQIPSLLAIFVIVTTQYWWPAPPAFQQISLWIIAIGSLVSFVLYPKPTRP